MSKFKIEDKVKVIKNLSDNVDCNKFIGLEGIITEYNEGNTWEYIIDFGKIIDDDIIPMFSEEELELVESKQSQENYQCEKCIHRIICKEKENWAKAYNDHIRLRKESALFDEEPICPCRMNKDEYKTKEEWENEYIDEIVKNVKDIPLTEWKESQDDIWNPIIKDAEKKIDSRLIKHEPVRINFGNVSELYNNIESLLLKR